MSWKAVRKSLKESTKKWCEYIQTPEGKKALHDFERKHGFASDDELVLVEKSNCCPMLLVLPTNETKAMSEAKQ